MKVKKIGTSSLTFYIEVHPNKEDNMRVSGEVIWVNTNQETHSSAPLSKNIIKKIELLEN